MYFNNPGNNVMNQHDKNGEAGKWSDSAYTVKAEPREFANVKWEESRMTEVFGLRNWKDDRPLTKIDWSK